MRTSYIQASERGRRYKGKGKKEFSRVRESIILSAWHIN